MLNREFLFTEHNLTKYFRIVSLLPNLLTIYIMSRNVNSLIKKKIKMFKSDFNIQNTTYTKITDLQKPNVSNYTYRNFR